jgi:Fur family ferric uptake transcriptional regulator
VNDGPEQATRAQDPIERLTIEQELRGCGLQVTAQRLAVMEAVTTHSHATTEELTEVVRGKIGSISRQAVYDTLGVFADKGLIRRIQPTGSVARYEGRVGDNHHHLVCRDCGLIFDIDCAVGPTPCLTADDDHGFEIDEAEVVYWGRCPDCRTEFDARSGNTLQPNMPTK